MVRLRLSLLFLVLAIAAQAQFSYVIDQETEVSGADGEVLALPWSGGLNAAQFNTMDIDFDGDEDLVLFDRMANVVIPFLNVDGQPQYAPEYQGMFPDGLTNWLMLRDFNCDGKKDIFSGDVLGIKVFLNTSAGGHGSMLQWERVLFDTGSGSKKDVLLTKGFSGKINLQLQFDDLPAIADGDGDGDLDIFNLNFGGAGTVEFHQNFSMERYGTCDSLDFERITQSWGNFKECHCGEFAFDGASCDDGGGRTKHAGGKTLIAFDENGDGLVDLLLSEASCTNLFLLPNSGSTASADVNSFSLFPADNPINFQRFPAAFFEDVDFDGKKDLVSSTNLFAREDAATNLERSVWLYRNTGTNADPEFEFVKNNFLQDEMIDAGDNAVPAFTDEDGDGDEDLLISRNTGVNSPATIFLYENIGTAASPRFRLKTNDYLNFSQRIFFNLKIAVTDLTRDGRKDLVFTASNISTGFTDLYLMRGKDIGILSPEDTHEQVDFNLTGDENLSFTDVDGDGFTDILAGRSNGKLQFWKSTGPDAFSLTDDNFLNIDGTSSSQNLSAAAGDLNGDGKSDLVLGDQTGRLKIISDYKNESTRTGRLEEIVFNPLTGMYADHNFGGRIWPALSNLFNTNRPSIAVGNVLGGIHLLRNDEGESLPPTADIQVYPNPLFRSDELKIKTDRPVSLTIFNVLGQLVSGTTVIPGNELFVSSVASLAPGNYFLRFMFNNKTVVRHLVVY